MRRQRLADEGAIVKIAGLKSLRLEGTALCFDCEEDAFRAVQDRAYKAGDVIVIRYEGPKGGPGMLRRRDASRHQRRNALLRGYLSDHTFGTGPGNGGGERPA